jgi:hypothetical protein
MRYSIVEAYEKGSFATESDFCRSFEAGEVNAGNCGIKGNLM